MPAVRDRLTGYGLTVNTANPPTPEAMWQGLAVDYKAIGDALKSVNYKPE